MAKKQSYDLAASSRRSWKTELKRDWVVYLLFLPIIIYEVVLHYLPMFGIVMAFQDYNVVDGYFRSPWVGMKHFIDLFSGEDFLQAIRNTVVIGLLRATIGFVAPIIFALMLSLINSKKFKRTCQTMSYMPNFVAAVIVCSLFTQFLAKDGPLTLFLTNAYSFENPFDEKCQKALRYIREAGGTYTHSALLKRMHESKDMFRQIIATLQENGSIVAGEYGTEAGRKIVYYRLTADSPKSIPKS